MRIAMIEPNPADAQWLKLMLDEAAVQSEATVFPSAVAALAVFHATEARYDVIVVNFQLPYLEIGEAVARLREASASQNAVIAVTITLDVEREMVPPGVTVLVKPVDVDQLRQLLRSETAPVQRTGRAESESPEPG